MLELWLVRHGESLGNLDGSGSDSPLSVAGREQAEALRSELAQVHFDRVLSSPLVRARETAALALPASRVEIEQRLRELVAASERFVDISSLTPEQLRALLESPASEPERESGKAFMQRVRAWVEALPDTGRILAFTHFAVVREVLRLHGPAPQTIAFASISIVRR